MTGSLQVKNGTIYMVINTYEGKKRKLRWISTGLSEHGNKRKAEQMLRETLTKMEKLPKFNQVKADIYNAPFADYVRYWLTVIAQKVDIITYQGYEILARTHILPYFDSLGTKLKDVSVEILQAYMDEKHTNGRKDGKGGLSARTMRMHKNVIHQALDNAVKNGLLPQNPCRLIELPKTQRYEYHVYTDEELQTLFEVLADDPMLPLIRVTAYYGLRRSELLGLKWDSIDFRHKLITIRRTVSKVTKAVEKDKTKNASSYRSFPLTPDMENLFCEIKAQQDRNRSLFARSYQESEYVFTWPDGHLYSPDYITDRFSKLLKKHDLPHIRFHELRHSCASLLLSEGFTLKDVQEWMGHADIKMTANIYGHLDVARKRGIADMMSEKLSPSASQAC